MKRFMSAIILVSALTLAACSGQSQSPAVDPPTSSLPETEAQSAGDTQEYREEAEYLLEAVVLNVQPGEMLIQVTKDASGLTADQEVAVYYDVGIYEPGQKLLIEFNGNIMASEPPKIAAVRIQEIE